MSRPLIVSIPHTFGRQEARRRLDAGIARLRPELGVFLSRLDYHWEDDTLKFIASALWQQITAGSRCWTTQCGLRSISHGQCSFSAIPLQDEYTAAGWLCWIGRPNRSYSSSQQMIMDPGLGAERKKLRDAYVAEFIC